jgi:hypothetical protein
MVQSCPMAMGFACPRQQNYLETSYGTFDPGNISQDDGNLVTCNYLGVDWPTLSAGDTLRPSIAMLVAAGVTMVFFLVGW